ncbi:MAG: F0F1 ATP synthase subunit epsilon [Daejeonella sp.]|uniref:F0F1 ATP synthase subunit epsilon n=1 Tax=Daejeonella sp. TaxID=2805397 RepID=UPI002733804D|nr:F0F1 ATP synthase subunit epsilon [Daejeonella sp.]MDP3468282.1 F0F1 ATP synthase subunit epsilon [Daejeonella sp.]
MNLKILLPFKVFADINNVISIIMETSEGSFGLLPHRLDCVAALVPGILTYETESGTHYLAIDEGVLVKTDQQVLVSVRNAIGGADLGKLHELIEKEFLSLHESETSLRSVMSKIEVGFMFTLEKFRKQ